MSLLSDTYTIHGALRLARAIERKWKDQNVKVWTEPKAVPGHKMPLWFVKSNLVNGLPPRAKARQAVA